MGTRLEAKEYPLCKIFSSDFDYSIPEFQRPYSWTDEETGKLFVDLYDFYKAENTDEQYFLGSIVLIKKPDLPEAQVIDGQQRLTTLTILLAVLTSKLSGNNRTDFEGYIIEPGRPSQGLASKPRLRLRGRDAEFFRNYVQSMRFDELFALSSSDQDTEAKENIIVNSRKLSEMIKKSFSSEDELLKFGAFIVQRCYLVSVSTPTKDAAFRIFSVLDSRGMSLLATDIVKADVIGAISETKRKQYSDVWEEREIDVGREGFNDLFTHIRMIKAKSKAKTTMQAEFTKYVLPDITEQTAIDFIDNTLSPYCDVYRIIKESNYSYSFGADAVNELLRWLNRIDNNDWIPVAMQFFVFNKQNPALLQQFLKKLERLAAYLRASSGDVNTRIERYGKILSDIDESHHELGNSIELTEKEKQDFLEILNSDIYTLIAKKRNYLILRLDSFLSDGGATYNNKILTIEHVLPQTVRDGSKWSEIWPDTEQRKHWQHKIGNLIPMARQTNSAAQNFEFEEKKEKYFTGRNGVSSFALASDVLHYDNWTPEVVEERQKKLIAIYRNRWEL